MKCDDKFSNGKRAVEGEYRNFTPNEALFVGKTELERVREAVRTFAHVESFNIETTTNEFVFVSVKFSLSRPEMAHLVAAIGLSTVGATYDALSGGYPIGSAVGGAFGFAHDTVTSPIDANREPHGRAG